MQTQCESARFCAVKWSVVLYSVRCCLVECSAVLYNARKWGPWWSEVRCCTVREWKVLCGEMECGAVQCKVLFGGVQWERLYTVREGAVQWSTVRAVLHSARVSGASLSEVRCLSLTPSLSLLHTHLLSLSLTHTHCSTYLLSLSLSSLCFFLSFFVCSYLLFLNSFYIYKVKQLFLNSY